MKGRWLLALAAICAGCGGGGGGGGAGSGGIKVTAAFDPYTRTVPGYADRLEVILTPPPGVVLPPGTSNLANLTRANPEFTFSGLVPSTLNYRLDMRAFTESAVVGTAIVVTPVAGGQTATVDVSNNLTTTISKIDVTGPQFATNSWLQMSATAKNAFNQVLFTGAGFSWGATDPTVISVDATGRMTGLQRGYTNVVAWINNPLISGEKLVGSLGYVPTRVVLAGVGGTASGMRDVDGEWYWTYSDPGGATDVAIDTQERIYMAIGSKVVRIDDLSGFGRVELSLGFTPVSIDVDGDGRIYMLDANARQVVRVDNMSGSNLTAYGSFGSGVGQFMSPNSVTVGRDGAVYVTDIQLDRVARFTDMAGQNWQTFGTTGSGVGQFNDPSDVDTDGDGWVYVMDSGNYRLCKFFTIGGGFWQTYGSQGTGVGRFGRNTFMSVEGDAFIYVHDASNNRVVRIASIAGDFWVHYTLPTVQSTGRLDLPDL